MLDNVLQRQKLVSVGEKSVSDFEHFHTTHPRPIQTPFWGIGVWIFVRLSTSFCTRQPDLHPWNPVSESSGHHKAENTDNLSDYQCFRQGRFISQVEPEGVEPSSKHAADMLSTSLVSV